MPQISVTHEDVARLFGDISDHRIIEILALGPSHEDLEMVSAWLALEDDVMGEMERPLTGIAARVYEIVATDPRLVNENNVWIGTEK